MQLTDLDRAALLVPAVHYLDRLAQPRLNELESAIVNAFQSWKDSHTGRDGSVSVIRGGLGLLSPQRERISVPANEAEPWEIDGDRNYIELAFRLWLGEFQPFTNVLTAHGLPETFAAVMFMNQTTPWGDSLIRANGMLARFVIGDLTALQKAMADIGVNINPPMRPAKRKRSGAADRARAEGYVRAHRAMRAAIVELWHRIRAQFPGGEQFPMRDRDFYLDKLMEELGRKNSQGKPAHADLAKRYKSRDSIDRKVLKGEPPRRPRRG